MLAALLALGAALGVVNNAQKGDKGPAGAAGEAGIPGVGAKVIYGRINSGAKVSGSAGWTSEKLGAGRVKVNVAPKFASALWPTANIISATLESFKIYVTAFVNGESFEIRSVNNAGALADVELIFHCFGD